MTTTPPTAYRPLARVTVRLRGMHRLYAAVDHLLSVDDQVSAEEYRRFYFSDIQVLTVGRTHAGKIWNAVWGFLAALLLVVVLANDDPVVRGIFVALTALAVVGLVLNVIAGPTATLQVVTAVQTEELRGVGRVRAARRILTELEPLIRAAQAADQASEPVVTTAANVVEPGPATGVMDSALGADVPPVISPRE